MEITSNAVEKALGQKFEHFAFSKKCLNNEAR